MSDTNTPKTLGERRVRTDFNTLASDIVARLKLKTADLINECQQLLEETEDPEVKRLCSLAMTGYEEGAMWAVKAATAGK